MRIAFAGTPEFAQQALAAMLAAGFRPVVVLTQPDRPAGRGLRLAPSPVKQLAQAHGIAVLQPQGLRLDGKYAADAAAAQQALAELQLDLMVVAAYGLILPTWLLQMPRYGCLNIHASLLPRWRGAAPIHRAIEAGDAETGISIMQMDEGLDTGAIVSRQAIPIHAGESTAQLHDRLAQLGGQCIVTALEQLQQTQAPLPSQPQPAEGISYAHKIERSQSQLDWQRPAHELARQICAFDPFPGAQALFQAATGDAVQTLKIWQAQALPAPATDANADADASTGATAAPGTVLQVNRQGVDVACGQGSVLRLLQLQRAGGKRQPVQQFLNGFAIAAGDGFSASGTGAATAHEARG
ncbi:methionyl-tRNA formyltransferase [Vandammella animalimorsus]|uniref:Methionyl-tRNA formyltransferase n=1 Tax=Vandammella animalimorsus TaxID=2029117 RepID=A0A2A2B202_9BURK|nr:methionyl-tRNA formyltransferase [Vandammella animalimorsus]PAT44151.1 methionyl-tRNA formyltransferase [Vandammella animalimorsus]